MVRQCWAASSRLLRQAVARERRQVVRPELRSGLARVAAQPLVLAQQQLLRGRQVPRPSSRASPALPSP